MKSARHVLLLFSTLTLIACYYLPSYRSYSDVNLGIEFEYDSAKWRLEKSGENLLVFTHLAPHAGGRNLIGFFVVNDDRSLTEYMNEFDVSRKSDIVLWGHSGIKVEVDTPIVVPDAYLGSYPLEYPSTDVYIGISDGDKIAVFWGAPYTVPEFTKGVRDFVFTAQPLNVDVNSGE